MSSRFNNKYLFYLLAGLVVIMLITVLIKIPRENATLRSRIAEFDTSAVNKIIIYPKTLKTGSFEFERSKNKWLVKQGDIVSATQEGAVQNIFGEVLNLKPQSLAAVKKSQWKEFELTDSLATRIKFLDRKGKTLADLMVGKMSYRQQDNPYAGYGGNNVQVTSYVRLYNERNVYAVEGFISFTFNTKFDDWRDKTFIRSDKKDITKITFTYPADSSYTISKNGNVWQIAGQTADSARVAGYINSLGLLYGQNIKDNYQPVMSPVYQMLVEGNNLLNISVKCYKNEDNDEFIVNSSLNPDVYFSSKRKDIPDRLFKPEGYFLNKDKEVKK
jgi:hypothetical protein